MTIAISAGYAAQMAAAGEDDNPIILWRNRGSIDTTWTQGSGSEVESPTFLETDSTYDRWIATLSGSGVGAAIADFGGNREVSMVGIAAHNLEGLDVRIQYSTDSGGSWSDAGAGVVTPTDNSAIIFLFTEAPATDFWRVRVSNGAASQQITIGVLYIGIPMTVPQRIYQGYSPPITPTQNQVQANVSEGGNLLGSSVVRKGSTAVANFTHLRPSFIRSTGSNAGWVNFQKSFNDGVGHFWVWRPTTFQDAFYAWRGGATIKPTNSGPKGYMSVSLEMKLYDDP